MKRKIAVMLLVSMVVSTTPQSVFAQENISQETGTNENTEKNDQAVLTGINHNVKGKWEEREQGMFYVYPDGSHAEGWTMIDGTEYYFELNFGCLASAIIAHDGYFADKDGKKMTTPGWHELPNYFGYMTTYYIYPDGKAASGWCEIDGKEYYFEPYDGSSLKNRVIDGYYLNEDGVKDDVPGWRITKPNGFLYIRFIKPDGKVALGWYVVDGKEYYFETYQGNQQYNKITPDGYYVDVYGEKVYQTGWYTIEGTGDYISKMYFYPNNKAAVGWNVIDGKEYYFGENDGVMYYGLRTPDGYLTALDGTKVYGKGWLLMEWINGNKLWTYINDDGTVPDGNCVIDGREYHFHLGFIDYDQYPLNQGQWMYNSNGYWYQWNDGSYPHNEKIRIEENVYYFDESGYMQTGWKLLRDKLHGEEYYYYFDESGHMLHDCWRWINGKCYYFGEYGEMAANTTIDGEYVDESGAWVMGQWMYSDHAKAYWYSYKKGGYPSEKFESIDGKIYYFDGSGYMVTGWQLLGGKWYYFDGSGAMTTGWQLLGGKWYYFNESGHMLHDCWQWINGYCYYFHSDGEMAKNENINGSIVNSRGAWVC